jgi:RNA polymerase sigma factor (sigma-70 family)
VVDEVAARTIADAIRSAASFEGGNLKQFRAWLFVIARRRRVDYLRKKRVDEVSLVEDFGDDETEREIEAGDPISAVDDASVWSQAFGELQSDAHKLVVILGELHDRPHQETAEHVNRQFGNTLDDPMTENNVSQILSRFRKRLDDLLEEADDPPPPPSDDD